MVFALSFLIISYLQVLLSKFIKSNHYCFSIYSFHAFLYTYCKSFFVNHVIMGAIDKNKFVFMDSIELLTKTARKIGQKCSVHVTSGDVYSGHYCGYCESTKENPLTLRLSIDAKEAERIGIS